MSELNIMANRKEHTQIDSLIVDVTFSESYEWVNSITKYPVEDGFYITDHIQQEQETFSIDCFFSNNPIYIPGTAYAEKDYSRRDSMVLRKFLEWGGFKAPLMPGMQPVKVSDSKLLDIVTSLITLTSMGIKRVNITTSYNNSGGLYAKIDFERLDIITNEFTEIKTVSDVNGQVPGMSDKIQNRIQNGFENTRVVEKDKSLLYKAYAKLTGEKEKVQNFSWLPGTTE